MLGYFMYSTHSLLLLKKIIILKMQKKKKVVLSSKIKLCDLAKPSPVIISSPAI